MALHTAPVWPEALPTTKYREMIDRAQRQVSLAVARVYRTVSTEATLFIGGLVPLQLQASSKGRQGGGKKEDHCEMEHGMGRVLQGSLNVQDYFRPRTMGREGVRRGIIQDGTGSDWAWLQIS